MCCGPKLRALSMRISKCVLHPWSLLRALMRFGSGRAPSSLPFPETLRKDIKVTLSNLLAALEELLFAYKIPAPDLVPRPTFYLLSQVTVTLYLLEHAIWSHTNVTTQSGIDIEAFSRWVDDFGLATLRSQICLVAGVVTTEVQYRPYLATPVLRSLLSLSFPLHVPHSI